MRVDIDGEDAVGTGTLFVHVSLTNSAIFEANLHIVLHFGYGIYLHLYQILHEDTFIWALFQLHLKFDVFPQQIVDLLVVNLDKAAPDQMSLRCIIFCDSYNLTERSGNDAS